ncbi:MAG: hypothetical protein MJ014_00050 [Methanocorpusculum sp.]|nr:hypothetical protein [Methanocorpusculum sp.]
MIIQVHSYRKTNPVCGFIRNPHGALLILPKASAVEVYSPVTAYTAHYHKDRVYEEVWDLTGAQLMRDQAGCECLLISNALNGQYLQIGKWERDPYTRRNPNYTPPKLWARSIRSAVLKPIEICNTGLKIPNTRYISIAPPLYSGLADADMHTGVTPDDIFSAPLERYTAHPAEPNYLTEEPTLSLGNTAFYNTATYAAELGIYRVRDKTLKPTSLSRDCPPPYNRISHLEFTDGGKLSESYTRKFRKYVQIRDNLIQPFAEENVSQDKMATVCFDTELNYLNDGYEPANQVRPVLWDWPIVLMRVVEEYAVPNGKKWKGRKSRVWPVVVVPIMLYHEPYTDSGGKKHGVIDGKTGRRWARGKCLIGFSMDRSVLSQIPAGSRVTFEMIQISHPITSHPIFSAASLKKLLEERK